MNHTKLFVQKLKNAGLSKTTPRNLVFSILYDAGHHPLSMNELLAASNDKVDRASVYRAVKSLEKASVIHRVNFGWKYKLELSDEFHGHHHHITCTACGTVHIIKESSELEKILENISRENGFRTTKHNLEIKGICSKCARKSWNPGISEVLGKPHTSI